MSDRIEFNNQVTVFDREITNNQLEYLYSKGLQQAEPYWNFGWPLLQESLPELQSGLWFVIAPENVGKSQFMKNLGFGALLHEPDCYWLDFQLDDSVENSGSYLLARSGDIPISLVKRAGEASDADKDKRKQGFRSFLDTYGDRYRVMGVSAQQEDAEGTFRFSAEWIGRFINLARKQIGPEKKLLVTIDGFHDIDLEEKLDNENSSQKRKSQILKRDSAKANALIIMSAHCRKDSRRRGMTSDILKGDDAPLYDAMVISHLYSDVGFNRDGASVFWTDVEDPEQRMMPVLELDILKNKCGAYRGVRFYNFDPRRCLVWEADNDTQNLYRSYLYAK